MQALIAITYFIEARLIAISYCLAVEAVFFAIVAFGTHHAFHSGQGGVDKCVSIKLHR